ncbi:pectin acetylesterase [Bryobacterales bacterium F-183]|nr:pectin acetylesterase [Bryobacterales bacterium F-183]
MSAVAVLCVLHLSQEPPVLLLRAPSKGAVAERWVERGTNGVVDRAVGGVSDPTVTVYLPAKGATRGILIAPGGGYQRLAIDKEGHDIARWLNTLGVAGFVLKYRLPGGENMRRSMGSFAEASAAAKVAMEDAAAAMDLIRKKYPKVRQLGMMGFSAGGHLAAMMAMSEVGRPDFLALIYPAVPAELRLDAKSPATFLVHAKDDPTVGAEHSRRFAAELERLHVPAELHVYETGGHGFGIRKNGNTADVWPDAFAKWLKAH